MSIDIIFRGTVKNRASVNQAMQNIAFENGYHIRQDEDGAAIELCSLGDMYISFRKGSGLFARQQLHGYCRTNTAGAGMHAAVIDFVDELAARTGMKIELEDPTGYSENRDFEALRAEHFYPYIEALAQIVRENIDEPSLRLCWRRDEFIPKEIAESVCTPMGRFSSRRMLERIERDGAQSFARDFFVWNNRERDAWYYRNSALNRMWMDCCFTHGDRSDYDFATNQRIIELIEKAVQCGERIPMPKIQYLSLCGNNMAAPVDLSSYEQLSADYPIGYRLDEVSISIGNVTVTYDGRLLHEWDDDNDCDVFSDEAPEDWHIMRITSVVFAQGGAQFSAGAFKGAVDDPIEITLGDGRCKIAFLGEVIEDDETYHQLVGQVIAGDQSTLFIFSFKRPEGIDWAMDIMMRVRANLPQNDVNNELAQEPVQ